MGTNEDLREALEQELRTVAQFPNYNPGPVLRFDTTGTVLLANRAALRLLGDEELEGKRWLDLCPGMNEELWTKALAATDEPFAHDARFGEQAFSFNHVRAEGADLVFAFGTDITKRINAEQEVREIARFPDMNPGPVLRLDPTSVVLLNNAAAQTVFGADLLGSYWLEICPGIDREFWDRVLASEDIVPLEAAVGDQVFVFHHRHDAKTELVFVFGSEITALKLTERALLQSEKMATLGTLAAGVAHELNNPAAATRRAADQLQEALDALSSANEAADTLGLGADALVRLAELQKRARLAVTDQTALDPLTRADRESEIEDWLDDADVDGAWELAPSLTSAGFTADGLDAMGDELDVAEVGAIAAVAARTFAVYALSQQIGEGSSRISQIVTALKGYSYLGQAPAQNVDLHADLDNTLVILNSKLKNGVHVTKDYATSLPPIPGFGGELNQVWTNLIDIAIDAMNGEGELTVRTREEGSYVRVDIVDNGPGIPEDVQSRIFDPFFTTKEQGKGTGLGLSTSYSIVVEKHGGTMSVESVPGRTQFEVRLPTGSLSDGSATDE